MVTPRFEIEHRRRQVLSPVGRWSKRKQTAVLAALARGDVSLSEVMAVHALSLDEIAEWRRRLAEDQAA
ncbi:MAG: DUF1153 domain-containing protein [Rhizomicrobium sp.]